MFSIYSLAVYGLAVISYLVVGGYLYTHLTTNRPTNKHAILLGLSLGAIFHAVLLYPNIVTQYGLNFNLFNAISLTSLYFLGFFIVFGLYRPILSLGLLAVPVALVGITLGAFGRAGYEPLVGIGGLLELHIILSFASYCVLLMGCVQAIILKLQIKELRHETVHRFWVSKLPPLQSMESLLFDMILLGFVILSVALALGFLATYDILAQHIAHKLFFSVLSWLVFGWLIFGHYKYGWQPRRAANMTIGGFILLAIGFIGSKVVLELVLK